MRSLFSSTNEAIKLGQQDSSKSLPDKALDASDMENAIST